MLTSKIRLLKPLSLLALFFCIVTTSSQVSTPVDRRNTTRLTRIAFGSCATTRFPQEHWNVVNSFHAQLWLWTGDAVYIRFHRWASVWTLEQQLKANYKAQQNQPDYAKLLSTGLVVDGIYDDHDLGLNDANKYQPGKNVSRHLYLDFLGIPKTSPRRLREGAYSSLLFGEENQQVKVILLDARYNREPYTIPSVGGWPIPLAALLGAATRFFSGLLAIGSTSTRDVLGEPQWEWLQAQLEGSTASVHIVVSSIQMFTSNPFFESWGHFPASRQRLVRLFNETQPKGLILLSGDVHFTELLGKNQNPTNENPSETETAGSGACFHNNVVEITSSGLTHSLAGAWFSKPASLILNSFGQHRITHNAYYPGKNYGTISLDWDEDNQPHVQVETHAILAQDTTKTMLCATYSGNWTPQSIQTLAQMPSVFSSKAMVVLGVQLVAFTFLFVGTACMVYAFYNAPVGTI